MAESQRGEEKGGGEGGGGVADVETRPKRRREGRSDAQRDPLVLVGPEVLEKILNCLDAHSVARCGVVSRGWRTVAISDRLWDPRVSSLCFSINFSFKSNMHEPRPYQKRAPPQSIQLDELLPLYLI